MDTSKTHRDGLTRRSFLKTTGSMAGAGLVLGSLPVGASAFAGAEATIKVGVIGCGGRGTGAAHQAIMADSGVKIVALADVYQDRVDRCYEVLAMRHLDTGRLDVPRERRFAGLDAYKGVVEASDVVLIANAAKFHPLHMQAAVEAGKHVFVEKPHAIDPSGIKMAARAMDLAVEKRLCVVSGLQSRFHAGIRETIQRVQDGQIGEIISMEENWLREPYGVTRRPEGLQEIDIQLGNQYRFSWLSGDDVTQSLVHNLDRVAWVLGEAPPLRCFGLGGRSGAQNLLGDVFDHNSIVYEYENGVKLYAHCRTAQNTYNQHSSTILGTKGTAHVLHNRIVGEQPWVYDQPVPDPYQEELDQMFAAIRRDEPIISKHMTLSTLASIMGQLSCYSGKQIAWEQAVNSDYVLPPALESIHMHMEPPTMPDENGIYPVCAIPGFTEIAV